MKKLIIHNNVRKLRFENNEMTQKDLSKLVGISRQTVVAIEKGQYSPTLELAFKLAHAFNKRVDEVFYTNEEED